MNCWDVLDRAKEKYDWELFALRQVARETHHAWVKCAETGVWSARRAGGFDGGNRHLHTRAAVELEREMQVNRPLLKRIPTERPAKVAKKKAA